jgi:hypothetical protein
MPFIGQYKLADPSKELIPRLSGLLTGSPIGIIERRKILTYTQQRYTRAKLE